MTIFFYIIQILEDLDCENMRHLTLICLKLHEAGETESDKVQNWKHSAVSRMEFLQSTR